MRAACFDTFGPAADVLDIRDVPAPEPAGGEVLIRLATSAVNPSDVKKRAGSFPDLLDGGYVIPNSDGAGTIEAVGDGVASDRVGERVWVYQAQFERRFGTAAQYVAIDHRRAVPLPDGIGYDVGACLGIPAMTAHRCVFADGAVTGQTILVTGGAGRVGHYAIQWASQAGARVVATASNDDDRRACRDGGADAVVDHRDPDFAAAVLDACGGEPVDRIVEVDFGANLQVALEVLRVGGTVATYASGQVPNPELPFFRMMYRDMTVRFVIVYAMPETAKARAATDISRALAQNRLRHRVGARLPLADIARANVLIEDGELRGAVILDIDG